MKLKNFLLLIRFPNLLILFFSQLFIRIFIIGNGLRDIMVAVPDVKFLILSFSTIAIAAGGYIINDYYDIKIDLINKPGRLVVGKYITRRLAIILHMILSFGGLIGGLMLSKRIFAINIFSIFLLWLYSNHLKRLPFIGNFIISLLTALSVFMVAVYYDNKYMIIATYAIFAFYVSLMREIVKDIEDLNGDASFNCKTLPIVLGIRKTKMWIYIINLLFVLNLCWMLKYFNLYVNIYLVSLVMLPLCIMSVLLWKADTHQDFKQAGNYYKIIMMAGIGSMLLLNI